MKTYNHLSVNTFYNFSKFIHYQNHYQLFNYEKRTTPDGLQNQSVLYTTLDIKQPGKIGIIYFT